jgi:hypothetical protein
VSLAQSLPDGPSGRWLAIGMAAAALGLLWFLIGSPILAAYDERAEALANQITVARHMQAQAALLPKLREEAAQDKLRAANAGEFLAAPTGSLAAAALQQQLHGIADDAGAVISSIETLPPQNLDGTILIGLRVTLRAQFPVIMHLLVGIAEARPRLLVDQFQLHVSSDGAMESSFSAVGFWPGSAGAPRAPGAPIVQ